MNGPIPPLRAILFDFDGTIVDSAELSYHCYVRAFERFGIAFDRERFETTYSPNWRHTYEQLGLPSERWEEADALWLEQYAAGECRLIDGVAPAVRRLERSGLRLGIVTSGSRSRVTPEIAALGLEGTFEVVVCAEDVRNRKPHPEGLERGIARLGVSPGEAAYVGDSPEDVAMARAARVFAIAVPGTYPNRSSLLAAPADLHATRLDAAVDAILAGRAPLTTADS
ncbi:MAG TPA: HAD family hydrolase [Thermoanaerobaculia bacterium]|nr:HAD family hydrolase [Thermoanaerobaculia bacterium]